MSASSSALQQHPHQHDLRHPLLQSLDDQQRGKDGTGQIAEAGDEREQRIDAEPDLRPGNPEPRVEQPAHARSHANVDRIEDSSRTVEHVGTSRTRMITTAV